MKVSECKKPKRCPDLCRRFDSTGVYATGPFYCAAVPERPLIKYIGSCPIKKRVQK